MVNNLKLTPMGIRLFEIKSTRKFTKALTIGFEWEVPHYVGNTFSKMPNSDYRKYPQSATLKTSNVPLKSFASKHGFAVHNECGCVEFASAKTDNLATAKSLAKSLMRHIRTKHTDVDFNSKFSDGGIHVHVKPPTARLVWSEAGRSSHATSAAQLYLNIVGLLNHKTNATFLMDLSGRNVNTPYATNARPHPDFMSCQQTRVIRQFVNDYCCDGFYDTSTPKVNPSMLKLNLLGTIEFRLFGSQPHLLIPAIEFAHSITNFVQKRKSYVPSLWEYKVWLFKQKGYTSLKAHGNWDLLPETKGVKY
jgi:hypothetical protein